MLKNSQQTFLLKSALLGLMLLAPSAAVASEVQAELLGQDSVDTVDLTTDSSEKLAESLTADAPIVQPTSELTSLDTLESDADSLGQVTSVSQLSDVRPTDWAFQALQSLVERYGCIAGYPNGTFRGNRSATRYEMAAALNACLDQISDRFASKADLDAVKALQDEFAAELATLRGRVDGLESRVATVEAQQFSTTTKLKGEAVFGAGFVFDEDAAIDSAVGPATDGGNVGEDRVFFGYRTRLNFDTSFNGKDRLRVRLEAADIPELDEGGSAGTSLARFGFDENDPAGSTVILDELNYRFKPLDGLTLKVAVLGGDYKDDVETFNPYLKSSGSGALSRFFRVNPVVHRAPGGTTFSAVYELNDAIELAVVGAADDANSPVADGDNNGGLFGGGQFGVLGQVGVTLSDNLRFGVQYARSEYRGGADITQDTGDAPATVFGGDTSSPFGARDTTTDNIGVNVDAKIADWLHFSGWGGLTFAHSPELNDSSVTLVNWAANFIFPDLLAEGNRGSLSVGMQPWIIDSGNLNVDDGVSANVTVEAQYQFKVNDNIKISPGVIVIFNPNNTPNEPLFVPVIRTTFKF